MLAFHSVFTHQGKVGHQTMDVFLIDSDKIQKANLYTGIRIWLTGSNRLTNLAKLRDKV